MKLEKLLIFVFLIGVIFSGCGPSKKEEKAAKARAVKEGLEKDLQIIKKNPVAKSLVTISPWNLLMLLSDKLDPSTRANALHDIAITMAETGNVQQALSLAQKMDNYEKPRTLQGIVKVMLDAKNLQQAAELANQLDGENKKLAYYDMAIALVKSDDLPQALVMAEQLDDKMKADAFYAIIYAMLDKGDIDHAKEIFPKAVAASTANTTGDLSKAQALMAIANTLIKMGNKPRAIDVLTQAFTFANKLQGREKFDILYKISFAYAYAGDFVQAIYIANQMEETGKIWTLGGLAPIVAENGDLQVALSVADKLDGGYRAAALQKIAVVLLKKNDAQGATELLTQALVLANQLKDFYKTDLLIDIAAALAKAGSMQQALGVAGQLENRERVWALTQIAVALHEVGDKTRALDMIDQAINVSFVNKEENMRYYALYDAAKILVKVDISEKQQTFSQNAQVVADSILNLSMEQQMR